MTRYIYDERLRYQGTREDQIDAKCFMWPPMDFSDLPWRDDHEYYRARMRMAVTGLGVEAHEEYCREIVERRLSPGAVHAAKHTKDL